jgi:hypothetical protein
VLLPPLELLLLELLLELPLELLLEPLLELLLEVLAPPLELVLPLLEPVPELLLALLELPPPDELLPCPELLPLVTPELLPLELPELLPLEAPELVPEPLLDVVPFALPSPSVPNVVVALPLQPSGSQAASSKAAHTPYELAFIANLRQAPPIRPHPALVAQEFGKVLVL